MQLVRGYQQVPKAAKGAVVALGNFDGVHTGHRAILEETRRQASMHDSKSAVLSFTPHPKMYFSPSHPPLTLTPLREKFRLLEQARIDLFFLLRFHEALASLHAEQFIQDVLVDALAVSHIVIGHDFIFGHQRSGNAEVLRAASKKYGFGMTQVDAVCTTNGKPYSSSRIRQLLSEGNLGEASSLLGYPFFISGHVRKGDQRGRLIGFPTANIAVAHRFCPAFGVYAVRAHCLLSQQIYYGVANIGTRPTFDGSHPWLEVHLFDTNADLYGKRLRVEFLHYLRPEQRFDGLEALTSQITKDAAEARQFIESEVALHA